MLNEILLKMVEVEQDLAIIVKCVKQANASGDLKRFHNVLVDAISDMKSESDKLFDIGQCLKCEAEIVEYLIKMTN